MADEKLHRDLPTVPTKTAESYEYSTDKELSFLRNLGTSAHSNSHLTRAELLLKYKATLELRTDWSGIDRATVFLYLHAAIKAENSLDKRLAAHFLRQNKKAT